MAMAITLREYLEETGSHYDVSTHTQTGCSMETAAVAHIPGDQLLKSVILKDDKGYVMAVIPSTYHVKVSELKEKLNRHLRLVTEDELAEVDEIDLQPMRKKNSKRADPPWIRYLQHHYRKMVETAGSMITQRFPKTIHAVTPIGFELKVVLFVLAFSIACL